ncbi:hypothetical protein [Streptomyces sp. MAR4 CNX-425]
MRRRTPRSTPTVSASEVAAAAAAVFLVLSVLAVLALLVAAEMRAV